MLYAAAAVIAIATVLTLAATRPAHLRVVRNARMPASPPQVFALVNDFHHWPQWSPWERLDPAMEKTFSGEPCGTGAVYAWRGNRKVGEGRVEIVGSEPDRRVSLQLHFIKPFAARNTSEFRIEPTEGGSLVTWEMEGPQAFPARIMGVFVNMDRIIGRQFQEGLANLAAAAAPRAATAAQ